ncbi:MAG: MoxR family ATPase [Planctomycetota bacterium]
MTNGPFEIVRPSTAEESADERRRRAADAFHGEAAEQSLSRELRQCDHTLAETAAGYVVDADLATAMNMALCVRAPLLVTGEPGTGKTQAAYHLAWLLGIDLLRFQARSTSTANDLRYDFDAVGYLRNAQDPEEDRSPRSAYVQRRELWQAYEAEHRCVLLIDEIDKAPRDFPNDLLRELDEHHFKDPFAAPGQPDDVVPKAGPPIVVATSNAERRLPDAFLRRCIAHHIEIDEPFLTRVVSARLDAFPRLDEDVRRRAVELFFELRNEDLAHVPSTAELLTWLATLSARGADRGALDRPLAELPGIQALIKDHQDRARLRELR